MIGLIMNFLGLVFLTLGITYILSLMTKTQFKDWLDWRRWKSVTIFILKWLLMKLGDKPGTLEPHEIEQYMFRIFSCSKCVDNGNCLNCSCNTVAKMNVRSDSCSLGRWGAFMNKEDWARYKEAYKVTFDVQINNLSLNDVKTDGYN